MDLSVCRVLISVLLLYACACVNLYMHRHDCIELFSLLKTGNRLGGTVGTSGAVCNPHHMGTSFAGPARPEDRKKKTLVLDLDETLVHSSFKVRIVTSSVPATMHTLIHLYYNSQLAVVAAVAAAPPHQPGGYMAACCMSEAHMHSLLCIFPRCKCPWCRAAHASPFAMLRVPPPLQQHSVHARHIRRIHALGGTLNPRDPLCSLQPVPNPDYIIPVDIDGKVVDVYVLKRPWCDHFMACVGEAFEVVVFTASLAKYAGSSFLSVCSANSYH